MIGRGVGRGVGRIFAVGSFFSSSSFLMEEESKKMLCDLPIVLMSKDDEVREARRKKRREAMSDLVKYTFGLTIFGEPELSEWEKEILKVKDRIWHYPTPGGDGYIYDYLWHVYVDYNDGTYSKIDHKCIFEKGWERCLAEAERMKSEKGGKKNDEGGGEG